MQLAPASESLGSVVADVRLADPQTDAVWERLRSELHERGLLIFRGQQLSDAEHVALAQHFGPIAAEGTQGSPSEVGFVSNARPDGTLGSTAASFHIDFGFFPHPYSYLSLYGLQIPPGGTETYFVSGTAAARTLPGPLRERLQGLSARQAIDLSCPSGQSVVRVREGPLGEQYPHMVRPVLWQHEVTGAEILGVWEQHTDALLPLPAAESTALIEELFAHLYQPAHSCTHRWEPHDLLIWDNHAIQHGRPDVGQEHPRTLRRVCIGPEQDLSLFSRGSAA